MDLTGRSQGEVKFIDRYARKMLVEWARWQAIGDPLLNVPQKASAILFRDYAVSKGWISKDGTRVLSKGFGVAASFLKS